MDLLEELEIEGKLTNEVADKDTSFSEKCRVSWANTTSFFALSEIRDSIMPAPVGAPSRNDA